MNTWLATQIGTKAADIVSYVTLFITAIIVVWLITLVVKRLNRITYVVGGKNRQARLSVLDAAPVDDERRLVLIKRDNVEHLILIGGPTDLVIERNITPSMIHSENNTDMIRMDNEKQNALSNVLDIFPAEQKGQNTDDTGSNNLQTNTTNKFSQLASDPFSSLAAPLNEINAPSQNIEDTEQTAFANAAIKKQKATQFEFDEPAPLNANIDHESAQSAKFKKLATFKDETNLNDSQQASALEKNLTETISSNKTADDQLKPRFNHNFDKDKSFVANTKIPEHIAADANALLKQRKIQNAENVFLNNNLQKDLTTTAKKHEDDFSNESQHGVKPALPQTNKLKNNDQDTSNTKSLHDLVSLPNSAPSSRLTEKSSTTPAKQSIGKVDTQSAQTQNSFNTTPSPNSTSPDVSTKQAGVKQQSPMKGFGASKPINPYAVMKANGAFNNNNNANFNRPQANIVNKNAVNANETGIKQAQKTDSTATSTNASKLNTKSTMLNTTSNPSADAIPNVDKTNNTLKTTSEPKNTQSLSSTTNIANTQKNTENSEYNSLNDIIATKVSSTNTLNKPTNDSSKSKGSTIGEKSTTQERPIPQRTSTPQVMLRPPLMAKPGNATITEAASIAPIAKNADTAPLASENEIIFDDLSIKDTSKNRPQSFAKKTSHVQKNEHDVVSSIPKERKATMPNKMGNLQKFSLQLLDPKHILDKPNRDDDSAEDKQRVKKTPSTAQQEEELDRNLHAELNQLVKSKD